MNYFRLFTLFIIFASFCTNSFATVRFDFDGDGKTDPTVLSFSVGPRYWYSLKSTGGVSVTHWGSVDAGNGFMDWATAADYDGDGKTDIAVWREPNPQPQPAFGDQAYFFILYSGTGTYDVVPWGRSRNNNYADFPVRGDFDGDGRTDVAISRQNIGGDSKLYYHIIQSRDGYKVAQFGRSNDGSVIADYDGDGKSDLAIARPLCPDPGCQYDFYIQRSSDSNWVVKRFGYVRSDYPISKADFDGDGKADIAVWSGKFGSGSGFWSWIRSSDGVTESVRWGFNEARDFPALGDYDGDGKTDLAIYRPNELRSCDQPSYFWIRGSTIGTQAIQWGSCHGSASYND